MRAVVVIGLIVALAAPARAEQLGPLVAVLAAEDLPPGLGVVEVHLPRELATVDAAPGDVTLAWPSPPRAGRPSARLTVRSARGTSRAWVPITLAPLATVTVAARALAPGEILTAADLRRETRAVSAGRTTPDRDALIGATVTTAVAADAPVPAAAVAMPPPVARGTEVRVIVRAGAVTATARGTLDRAARPGQPVSVHLASRGVVRGVLTDAGTVTVTGGSP